MAYHLVKFNPSMNRSASYMFIPKLNCNWGSKNPLPSGYTKGDKIIYWESGSGAKAVIALGEAASNPVKTGRESRFDLTPTTGYRTTSLTQEALRDNPLFSGATFLKAAVAATVYPLTDEQGEYLYSVAAAELADTFREDAASVTTFDNDGFKVAQVALEGGKPGGPISFYTKADGGYRVYYRILEGGASMGYYGAAGGYSFFDCEAVTANAVDITFHKSKMPKDLMYGAERAEDVLMAIASLLAGGQPLPTEASEAEVAPIEEGVVLEVTRVPEAPEPASSTTATEAQPETAQESHE